MKDKGIKSIICGGSFTIIYKMDGTVFVFGYNKYGQLGLGDRKKRLEPTFLMKDKMIKTVVCGNRYTIIYKNNGELLVFGDNRYGQLLLDDTENILIPTLIMKDPNIISINGTNCKSDFSINNYKLYTKNLKDIIWAFLLVHKIKRFNLPKWLRVHVIKFIYENY
jgi:alpha-tubulin suppressor-like RCC1 family protein